MEQADDEPGLEFIAEGTKKIWVPKGLGAEFCPHLVHCPNKNLDTNCFYEKFLHCDEARDLEKTHPLNERDSDYLRRFKNS